MYDLSNQSDQTITLIACGIASVSMLILACVYKKVLAPKFEGCCKDKSDIAKDKLRHEKNDDSAL